MQYRSIFVGLYLLLSIIRFHDVLAQQEIVDDSLAFAQIAFEKTYHNFRDMNQGEKAEHFFEFKNIGNTPLILNNVLSTCGCTVPEWPREPILPDSVSHIKVVFDSTSKIGRQNKAITIRSNSRDGDFRLRVSAMVLPSSKRE